MSEATGSFGIAAAFTGDIIVAGLGFTPTGLLMKCPDQDSGGEALGVHGLGGEGSVGVNVAAGARVAGSGTAMANLANLTIVWKSFDVGQGFTLTVTVNNATVTNYPIFYAFD